MSDALAISPWSANTLGGGNNTLGGRNNPWGGVNKTWSGGNNPWAPGWNPGSDNSNISPEAQEDEEIVQLLGQLLGGNTNNPWSNLSTGQGGNINPLNQNDGWGGQRRHHEHCMPGAFPGCGGGQPPWAQNGEGDCRGASGKQPGALSGVSVWGDPHIQSNGEAPGANNNGTQQALQNALFINGNGVGVLEQATASNGGITSSSAYTPNQLAHGISSNPDQTEVYTTNAQGQVVADGTAASLGYQENTNNKGTSVGSQPLFIGDGTSVSYNPHGAASSATTSWGELDFTSTQAV